MKETILVTGCAGFIGSHVSERLLSRGDRVVGIDNLNDYYSVSLKKSNLKILRKHKNFVFYKCDIRNYEKLKYVFSRHRPSKAIHLAARAGVRLSIKNPVLYISVNIKGTLALLELARQFNLKNFVFASSSSVYGNRRKVPFLEDDDVSKPISPYALTKVSGEMLCRYYHDLHGIPITCLRFFTVYGPRGRPDMAVYKFTKLILDGKQIPLFGDGSSSRDYTYISDIANGVVSAIDKNLGFEIINLGNSSPVRLNELVSLIEKNAGIKAKVKKMPLQPGDVERTFADIKKAKRLLGYNPKTRIEDGINEFVEWYKKNGGFQ